MHTLDDLHDDLLFNIAILIEANRESAPKISASLEPLFMSALEFLAARENELTADDWKKIGQWLRECESYFDGYDFHIFRMVLSRDPQLCGKQEKDLSGFVERARAAVRIA